MKNSGLFKNFNMVTDSEILESSQMNMLEAGAACENGCKKACMGGGQNYSRRIGVNTVTEMRADDMEEEKYI